MKTQEEIRLEEARERRAHWKRWGPYLSERAWGTVREDYSPGGDAWGYLPHDHARSRAYRWNEDGIAGISDRHQHLCFAVALWNGRDPILKERLFGVTGSQGNHGEDVKELYHYLDSTPTHSLMRMLYKYPQAEFPYSRLVEENRRRGREALEYEITDTGVFDGARYFDVFVEYAKGAPEDILVRIEACNRGPDAAELHLEAVDASVSELAPGDFVVATVRRPGPSLYDLIGTPDMTTDDVYRERGINLLHGFLSDYFVDAAEHIVRVPRALAEVGVLLEPLTVVEKGLAQAYEIQRRVRVWRPRRAAVVGVGTIGLLATAILRLRGLEVTAFGKALPPSLNASLVEATGARYLTTLEWSIADAARRLGAYDIVFEASGFSPLVFDAMQGLAKNGVLVLSSVTGGDRRVEVPADKLNLEFVLGNKVMVGTVNAGREYFELGVRDLAHAQAAYPGFLKTVLTHPVQGLERVEELFEKLNGGAKNAIKVFCEVSTL